MVSEFGVLIPEIECEFWKAAICAAVGDLLFLNAAAYWSQ